MPVIVKVLFVFGCSVSKNTKHVETNPDNSLQPGW